MEKKTKVKTPWDVVLREPIYEAVQRGCEKFHVPQSVFVLLALEHLLKLKTDQHPYTGRIVHYEYQTISAAKNRAEKKRAEILALLAPTKKTREEKALAKAKQWLADNGGLDEN